jgi:hypothetical protein
MRSRSTKSLLHSKSSQHTVTPAGACCSCLGDTAQQRTCYGSKASHSDGCFPLTQHLVTAAHYRNDTGIIMAGCLSTD